MYPDWAAFCFDTSGFGRNKYFSTLQFSESEQGQLKDVVVQANKRTEVQKLDDRYASGLFKGDTYQFDLVNDRFATATQNIFQFLQSRVLGLQINNVMSDEGIALFKQEMGNFAKKVLDRYKKSEKLDASLGTRIVIHEKALGVAKQEIQKGQRAVEGISEAAIGRRERAIKAKLAMRKLALGCQYVLGCY